MSIENAHMSEMPHRYRPDRRQILTSASAVGLLGAISPIAALAQSAPRKGGTLRLGMAGGWNKDSLDPRTYADVIPIACSRMLWNSLVEIDDKGNVVPELAESWESRPGAAEWYFNIRKGIAFGSGKTLDADDVIYSINLHRTAPANSSTGGSGFLAAVKNVTKTSPNQIKVELSSGNADLPYVFSDYHMVIVASGTTDFAKVDGTGAFTLVEWQPGVRIVAKRKPGDYWKPQRGNFDGVELLYMPAQGVRTQALLSGQVDAINQIEPKTAALLAKRAGIRVARTPGAGTRFTFAAQTDKDPFKNRDLLLALKYGIDRQKILDNVFAGFGIPGNDHTIGPTTKYYDPQQELRRFDPDKAKFYLKKSGFTGRLELQVSEGAFTGATDCALIFQESAKLADISINVRSVSADGYWDKVWRRVPFCAAYWGSRPTADLALSTSFLSGGGWNDTNYANPVLDRLLLDARVELDETKRSSLYAQAQALVSEEAGMLCFAITDLIDGCSTRVMGLEPRGQLGLSDMRLPEKGWFA